MIEFEFFGIAVFSVYIAFIIYISFHLLRLKIPVSDPTTDENIYISILVAVRNEAENIELFIQSILNQSYLHFELILMDDNSDDNTLEIIGKFNDSRIRVCRQNENVHGKKEAIKTGLSVAKNEWILFTDADVFPKKYWLWSYIQQIHKGKAAFIMSPVMFTNSENRFLDVFQQMDFAAMQYISLAAAQSNKPFMCNGANMAIKKDIAIELYQKINTAIPSGDDVFLLHAFLKEKKGRVGINLHQDSLIRTKEASTWEKFINQRLRWASKAKYYSNPMAIFVSWLIFTVNLWMTVALICSLICFPKWFLMFVAFWLVKMASDFMLFYIGKRIIPLHTWWKYYFPFISFIYFLYISSIGILSLFMPLTWKGRSLK
jgi:cellulose synthase/poly-beta-1,6-N-acetylglucosamine synthase-like glycosyltransferase